MFIFLTFSSSICNTAVVSCYHRVGILIDSDGFLRWREYIIGSLHAVSQLRLKAFWCFFSLYFASVIGLWKKQYSPLLIENGDMFYKPLSICFVFFPGPADPQSTPSTFFSISFKFCKLIVLPKVVMFSCSVGRILECLSSIGKGGGHVILKLNR